MSVLPMPHSTRSSSGSARCRIEWRPSRWLLAALTLLAFGAPAALVASGLPELLAWPSAVAALLHGVRLLVRHARSPMKVVEFRTGPGKADVATSVDDALAARAVVEWRGPLAFLSWRSPDGRLASLAWWPDTLPPAARRELRLVAPGVQSTGTRASMAP